MPTEVIMPKLGMTMTEGTVVEWLKKENDPVKKGEPIAEISSEKIENEIEAPEDGVLLKIVVKENEVVPIATPIGYIGQMGESIPGMQASSISFNQDEEPALASPTKPSTMTTDKKRIPVSPSARKLAHSLGIDIENIVGTGPNGRITNADVQKFAEQKENERISDLPKDLSNTNSTVHSHNAAAIKPLAGMRKAIADKMLSSMQQTAQLTIMLKADVTELLQLQRTLRIQLDQEEDVKLSITDFLAKAVIKSLIKHKEMNSTNVNGEIHSFDEVHLGIAVALQEGLIVPVIFNAEKRSLSEVSKEIKSITKKARNSELKSFDIQGSTFTITNLGKSGTEYFTPVLNSPETGILGVGTIQALAVFNDDNQIVRRDYMPLSLTFDHRILDGEPASAFLNTVKSYLEKPYNLLL